MKPEHTPGPWSTSSAFGVISNEEVICRVRRIRNGQGAANARLIAAAPDLLDALQATLAELREFRRILVISVSHGERMGGWLEDVEGMIAKIESAIAKAEGKS